MSNSIVLPRHRDILKTIFSEPDFSTSIGRVMREEAEDGAACGWRSCTGCHETNEGAETGDYPYSPMFQAFVGSGCGECGGIGVVWEYWAEDDLKAMVEDGTPEHDGIAKLRKALQAAGEELELIEMRLRDKQPERALGAAMCGQRDIAAALSEGT